MLKSSIQLTLSLAQNTKYEKKNESLFCVKPSELY